LVKELSWTHGQLLRAVGTWTDLGKTREVQHFNSMVMVASDVLCLWFVDAGMNPMTLIVIVFWCLIWQDLDLGSAPLCCIRRYIICFSVSCNIIIYEQNYLASVHKRILRHSLHLPAIHFSCIIDRALVNYQNCV
jgi:hypothetical protein